MLSMTHGRHRNNSCKASEQNISVIASSPHIVTPFIGGNMKGKRRLLGPTWTNIAVFPIKQMRTRKYPLILSPYIGGLYRGDISICPVPV